MRLADITPLVLTFNEAANIDRTLSRLSWAGRVVVLDSCSTDETVAICRRYANVEVVERRFDDHTSQWNYGLAQVRSPWVLSLDADYVLTDGLVTELEALSPAEGTDGYAATFDYCVFGRPLRASLYPPRVVLFRLGRGRYVQDGHTQLLAVDGRTAELQGHILHDDRKSVDRWLADQIRYSQHELVHLTAAPLANLNRADRLRRTSWAAPLVVMAYALFVQGLILDGWRGWYYVLQRMIAELMLTLRLVDHRLRSGASGAER